MRTWILCADNLCAQIFMKKGENEEPSLYRTIPNSRKNKRRSFVKYVSDEIELACGAGTESQLVILCGEAKMLKAFLGQVSVHVTRAVAGTAEIKNLYKSESMCMI